MTRSLHVFFFKDIYLPSTLKSHQKNFRGFGLRDQIEVLTLGRLNHLTVVSGLKTISNMI